MMAKISIDFIDQLLHFAILLPTSKKIMRIALIIIIGIHGIIHLFGFLKAFGISEFTTLSQPISKTFGLIWLLTFLLFALAIVLFILQFHYWWLSGFLAVVVSQVLIFNYWSDTKFGSIANLIILVSLIITYSSFSFKNMIAAERSEIFKSSEPVIGKVITKETISELPSVVQKWLINNGTIGKSPISNVHLTQELKLKMKTEQSEWYNGTAEQYFTVKPPAFNWNIETQINSVLKLQVETSLKMEMAK